MYLTQTLLKFFLIYKNGKGISKRNFNHLINSEKIKIEIPRNFYLEYLDKKY
jgi:hypothetical protein